MSLEIVPLNCGQITQVERSTHQYFNGFGEKIVANINLWLIRGGEHPIVVDLSCGTPDMVAQRYGRELIQTPEQHPLAAVEAAGVDPADVRSVVLTHLHLDHCLGLELNLFPNAKIYIQREELRYAAAPYPPHFKIYDPQVIKKLLPISAMDYPNVEVVNGDFRLTDGVDVLLTPGHTPGTQAVVVDTDEGVYAIASDNVPFENSWGGKTMGHWVPTGIHVSLDDCYESMARIAYLADVVLPSHDYSVHRFPLYPSPGDREPPTESTIQTSGEGIAGAC